MTSKEFKIWLEGFLTSLNLETIEVRDGTNPNYNNLNSIKLNYFYIFVL
jgi:hypothetical protein